MDQPINDALVQAIAAGVETRSTEFKESQPFERLRWRTIRAIMAMANLRDGGRVIIGFTERTPHPTAVGVAEDHVGTYTQDAIIEAVNRFARPPITLTVRVVEHDGRTFVGIEVLPFERLPVMCIRDNGQGGNDRLRPGDIFVRSNDRIATTRLVDPDLLSEVLEIAAERRARHIIATAQHIGLQLPDDTESLFRGEREDFDL